MAAAPSAGDLWEGKRTVMLIHLLRTLEGPERARLVRFLALARDERHADEVAWVLERMMACGSLDFAREYAGRLASAARDEAELAFSSAPSSVHRDFLLGLPAYMIGRQW